MFVSHTVLSLTEMVKFIFTIPGVTVFLSNKICQDSLENFFGQQRQRGRVHENPSVSDFLKNTQALRVINGGVGMLPHWETVEEERREPQILHPLLLPFCSPSKTAIQIGYLIVKLSLSSSHNNLYTCIYS